VYAKTLRRFLSVVLAVALLGFVLMPAERSIKLKEQHTEFGIREEMNRIRYICTYF
jgi:hypothetical protein